MLSFGLIIRKLGYPRQLLNVLTTQAIQFLSIYMSKLVETICVKSLRIRFATT